MIKLAERFNNWLEGLEVRRACVQRKKLLRRLHEAVMLDRTESLTRQILKAQMQGLSPEFLNYVP